MAGPDASATAVAATTGWNDRERDRKETEKKSRDIRFSVVSRCCVFRVSRPTDATHRRHALVTPPDGARSNPVVAIHHPTTPAPPTTLPPPSPPPPPAGEIVPGKVDGADR